MESLPCLNISSPLVSIKVRHKVVVTLIPSDALKYASEEYPSLSSINFAGSCVKLTQNLALGSFNK
jgi:hypothetical protein